MAKQVTVQMLAQIVSTDRVPVNGEGEEFGQGWQNFHEWTRRTRSTSQFCPRDLRRGSRVVFYENYPNNPRPIMCSCHKKLRLVGKRIAEGGDQRG